MVSKRVYFSVFGSGLGHITKALEIAQRLDGYESMFSTSGQGLEHIRTRADGKSAFASPPLDVQWKEGGFSAWHVLPRFPITFNAFLRQVAFERRCMDEFDPGVVVSESRLSPIIAAKEKSHPVVTLLNQFQVSFPPRFRSGTGKLFERIAGDYLGALWSLSDEILMTDLPPPYTIAEANLLGSDLAGVVEFVGFIVPRPKLSELQLSKTRRVLEIDRRPLVFCQVSGPDETKAGFADTILRAVPILARDFNLVVSMGRTSGSSVPRRIAGGAWVYDWCPEKDELFELADIVVARAGHNTIAQCIDRGKPAVLIPIHNHPEQIGNAEKFSRLGLGIGIRAESVTSENLAAAVRECLNGTSFKSRIEKMRNLSRQYDGVERSTEIIRSFA